MVILRVATIACAVGTVVPATGTSLAPNMHIDVTAYGADPSGRNDSTQAIQAAFGAAADAAKRAVSWNGTTFAGEPVVWFPGGTYTVYETLNLSRWGDTSAPSWPGGKAAVQLQGDGLAVLAQQVGGRDVQVC